MIRKCYEFDVQIMINYEFVKRLQKIRIIASDYKKAKFKFDEHFAKHTNVKIVDVWLVDEYNIIE